MCSLSSVVALLVVVGVAMSVPVEKSVEKRAAKPLCPMVRKFILFYFSPPFWMSYFCLIFWTFPWFDWKKSIPWSLTYSPSIITPNHHISSHFITFHHISLLITFHYISSHFITHHVSSRFNIFHYSSHFITFHFSSHFITFYYSSHFITFYHSSHFITFHHISSHFITHQACAEGYTCEEVGNTAFCSAAIVKRGVNSLCPSVSFTFLALITLFKSKMSNLL